MPASSLLALDTSTEACSAALLVDGQALERYEILPRGHAERVLGMVRELLAEAGVALSSLHALTFCRGPGAFTGVRIGVGVAQGLAFGADLPVAPVSTLAVLAQGAVREHGAERILASIDARMGEVYWAAYRAGADGVETLTDESVGAPEDVVCPVAGSWIGVGTGWRAHGEVLARRCPVRTSHPQALPRAFDCLPLAQAMLTRGELVPPQEALPLYLRDRVTR